MGSDGTAITIPGRPRVIDVFYGNEAPSGPNYTLFSGADRLLEASRGRSGSGLAPAPLTPSMQQPRGLGTQTCPKLAKAPLSAERLAKICCKRRRVRCRRLHATTADPKRTPGDLRAANRQDSIGAAVMAGPSISRIKKIIFFAPQ